MNEEILDTLNELSKKPITELAMSYMEVVVDNIVKDKEIERLNKIIDDIDKYIHYWNNKNIDEKTMLILNDILLIKNNMGKEVVRLQELKEEGKNE